jgi:hypothetical protein
MRLLYVSLPTAAIFRRGAGVSPAIHCLRPPCHNLGCPEQLRLDARGAEFSYLDFLRDVGKNFPVNVMLAKDSVKGRLERDDAGMSYTEFSYMLLQAYDFVHLHEQHGCELQVGGSDQWGNITAGIDLARRMRGVQLYGMTCPLLDQIRRHQDGQDRAGRGLARRPSGPAPTPSTSTGSTSPTTTPERACGCSPSCLGTRSRRSTSPAQPAASSRKPEALAEELTRLVHGEMGWRPPAGDRRLFRRRDRRPQRRATGRDLCRRAQPSSCPASVWPATACR